VAVEHGHLVIKVTDDGRGFVATGRESGLANLRRRAEQVGGSCEIRTAAGEGTTVRWAAPLLVAVADRQMP
jgi:signal transduction histidine kinase